MQPLFAIPPAHQKGFSLPGLNLNQKRGAPRPEEESPESRDEKAGKLKLCYDAPVVGGEKREALARSILAGLQDAEGNFVKKLGGHGADDEALLWMRKERQRAEDRAEKRWRAKFQEWVRRGDDKDFDGAASAPLLLRRPNAKAAAAVDAAAAKEVEFLRGELAEERHVRVQTERLLEAAELERGAWRRRAEQLEQRLAEVTEARAGTRRRLADLDRLLAGVGEAEAPARGQEAETEPAAAGRAAAVEPAEAAEAAEAAEGPRAASEGYESEVFEAASTASPSPQRPRPTLQAVDDEDGSEGGEQATSGDGAGDSDAPS